MPVGGNWTEVVLLICDIYDFLSVFKPKLRNTAKLFSVFKPICVVSKAWLAVTQAVFNEGRAHACLTS